MSVVEIYRPYQVSLEQRLRAHLSIAGLDHSVQNLLVVPGVIIPLCIMPGRFDRQFLVRLALAALAVTLVACSNYVINEVLDAPYDRLHPTRRNRPAAQGLIISWVAYVQWFAMMVAGVGIGFLVSPRFALTALALWVMGCLYNFPPVRTKDVPYLDVLTESANNPLRMLLGWYAVTSVLVPPVSLLASYWMIGAYFMALKRFSELSETGNRNVAGAYRTPFRYYTPQSLLVSVVFYASAAMLFLGAFIIRYRMELILAFPLVALTMAVYCKLSFKSGSSVQTREKLYREPLLMASLSATVVVLAVLFFVRIPQLERFFMPSLPQSSPGVVAALTGK